ncbi:CHAF1B (predicted) [Pycnogonum litorale]
MKCTVPEISWHNRDPVLSVDFQYGGCQVKRIATGGTDSHVLIWYVSQDELGTVSLDFACDLTRHQKSVNIVRFSPNGDLLASADDGIHLCLILFEEINVRFICFAKII